MVPGLMFFSARVKLCPRTHQDSLQWTFEDTPNDCKRFFGEINVCIVCFSIARSQKQTSIRKLLSTVRTNPDQSYNTTELRYTTNGFEAMAQKAVWRPRLAKRVLQIPGSGIREAGLTRAVNVLFV